MAANRSTLSLLSLPGPCLQRIWELALTCDEEGLPEAALAFRAGAPGAVVTFGCRLPSTFNPEAFLACKELWCAAQPSLHACARVRPPRVQPPHGNPAAALYSDPLREHASSLRQLSMTDEESWPGGASFAASLAAVAAAQQLRKLTVTSPRTAGTQEFANQLHQFTGMEEMQYNIVPNFSYHDKDPPEWPAWPPSLRVLSVRCSTLSPQLAASLAPLTSLRQLHISCQHTSGVELPLPPLPQSLTRLHVELQEARYQEGGFCLPGIGGLAELRVTGEMVELHDGESNFAGSGKWLESSRLQRLMLGCLEVEQAPGLLGCSRLQALELGKCKHNWTQPVTLCQLSRLTRLVLQGSTGEGTPANTDFSCLPLLEELSLAGELLTQLPAGVAGLSTLRALDVSFNKLTDLPAGAYLASLRQLSMAFNPIRRLPAKLEAASALEALDLSSCPHLEHTGSSLAVLPKMPRLQALHYKHGLLWTSNDTLDMPRGADHRMEQELDRLQGAFELVSAMTEALSRRRGAGRPASVDTASRLALFEIYFDEDTMLDELQL